VKPELLACAAGIGDHVPRVAGAELAGHPGSGPPPIAAASAAAIASIVVGRPGRA
jgi:hypothetical protein